MSFWTRQVKKFNSNHDETGRFASGPDSGPMVGETFKNMQDGSGYSHNPDPRDDKMAVLSALLDKAKMATAQRAESHKPNDLKRELDDLILADDEA